MTDSKYLLLINLSRRGYFPIYGIYIIEIKQNLGNTLMGVAF